jgi:hypothetical protein
VLAVLAAVGTGVGVLGWVAFVGGAILWVRAHEAGLPPAQSVAVTPRAVLLAVGAEILSPAAGAAILGVILLYAWNAVLESLGRQPVEQAEASVAQLEDLQANYDTEARAHEAHAESMKEVNNKEEARRSKGLAESAYGKADDAKRGAKKAKEEIDAGMTRDRVFRPLLALALLVLFEVAALVIGPSLPLNYIVLAVIVVATPGLALSYLILIRARFIWFGVVAFVSLGSFVAAMTFLAPFDNPKVEPAALLRVGGGVICGSFVAQTDQQVFLGTYSRPVSSQPRPPAATCIGPAAAQASELNAERTEELPPRLIAVPRDEVIDLAISAPLPLKDDAAAGRSAAMALDLCERQRVSRGGGTSGNERACAKPDEAQLRSLIESGPAPPSLGQ